MAYSSPGTLFKRQRSAPNKFNLTTKKPTPNTTSSSSSYASAMRDSDRNRKRDLFMYRFSHSLFSTRDVRVYRTLRNVGWQSSWRRSLPYLSAFHKNLIRFPKLIEFRCNKGISSPDDIGQLCRSDVPLDVLDVRRGLAVSQLNGHLDW